MRASTLLVILLVVLVGVAFVRAASPADDREAASTNSSFYEFYQSPYFNWLLVSAAILFLFAVWTNHSDEQLVYMMKPERTTWPRIYHRNR